MCMTMLPHLLPMSLDDVVEDPNVDGKDSDRVGVVVVEDGAVVRRENGHLTCPLLNVRISTSLGRIRNVVSLIG